jgi:hypothetical protein
MTWFDLPRMLRAHLLDSTDVTDKVAQRVHYQTIPDKSVLPHVWLTREGQDTEDMLGDEAGMTVERFSLEIVAETQDEELVDAVVAQCLSLTGTVGEHTVELVDIEDVGDDYVFKSVGEGDAGFLHAFQISVYLL